MLNLLKLDQQVINKLKDIGKTFNKKTWGEKTLRYLLSLNEQQQKSEVDKLLLKTKGSNHS